MMITWSSDLNTGIELIDRQHRQIVDYINQLCMATQEKDKELVEGILEELVGYTMSHFAFEESLQEEAGYKFCMPHKRIHGIFIRRVDEYIVRFKQGEDVIDEVNKMLVYWLIHHIKFDDADYVAAVKTNMLGIVAEKEENKEDGWLKRFFK